MVWKRRETAPRGSSAETQVPIASQIRDGLSRQVQGALESEGAHVTIMVVGESGVGKTSLLSNLFHHRLDWPTSGRTQSIREQTVAFGLEDSEAGSLGLKAPAAVPFEACVVDSPGWGDTLSLRSSFRMVTEHIERRYRRMLREERQPRRTQASSSLVGARGSVDVVLYIFSPHRCKEIDLEFLRRLDKV